MEELSLLLSLSLLVLKTPFVFQAVPCTLHSQLGVPLLNRAPLHPVDR